MTKTNRNSIIIILLIIVIGGLFLTQSPTGKEYFSWVKDNLLSGISMFKPGMNADLDYEKSRPDFSDISIESLINENKEEESIVEKEFVFGPEAEAEAVEEQEIQQEVVEEVAEPEYKAMTLEEIEKEVIRIAIETQIVEIQVKKLIIIAEIEKEIKSITEEIYVLTQEMITLG